MQVSDKSIYLDSSYYVSPSKGTDSSKVNSDELKQSTPQQSNYDRYKETVDSKVEYQLGILGLIPNEDNITLFDKKYSEGNYTCTKRNDLFGGSKIIKEENFSIAKSLSNILTGERPEKIIEEYDKKGNLTKKTYYKNDGSYVVSKYYDDGKLKEEAEVRNTNNNIDDYKTEIKITNYNKDGSYYVQEFSYEMDDTCDDNQPKEYDNITYYNAKGEVDLLSGITYDLLLALIPN